MKIFGIGLQKTETTSLSSALEILGYKTIQSPRKILKYNGNELSIDYSKMNGYDAFLDIPIVYFYKELDKKFPNSKFILTTRDLDKWTKSAEKHFTKTRAIFRENVRGKKVKEYVIKSLGNDVFNYERFVTAYQNHNKQVQDYFQNRKKDFLIMNICEGDSWEKLCSFLNKPIPKENFPQKNQKSNLKNFLFSDSKYNPVYYILNYPKNK